MAKKIIIESIGGSCPVQASGTIDGKEFYFRSRGQGWSFAVAANVGIDPVDINATSEQGYYLEESYGESLYDAGYMPEQEAKEIITRCVEKWLENSIFVANGD
jgi:hypothetical protein